MHLVVHALLAVLAVVQNLVHEDDAQNSDRFPRAAEHRMVDSVASKPALKTHFRVMENCFCHRRESVLRL